MSVTTETGGVEYAVQIRDGETLIGGTEATGSQSEAKRRLRALERAYPASTLAYRTGPKGEWLPADDDALDRIAYRHTAVVLAGIIGEKLTLIRWAIHPYKPDEIDGQVSADDGAPIVAEYAALLKVELAEEKSYRDGWVQLTACGIYRDVKVTVSAQVEKEPVSVSAEQAGGEG